jgi:hypothetical protein
LEPWRRRLAYAVTDRRALVVEQRGTRCRVESYGPLLIARIERRDRRDGRGDVWFRRGPIGPFFMIGDPIGFFALRDADAAEAALWHLRASRGAGGAVPPPRPWNSGA